jgi:hypothetical protein
MSQIARQCVILYKKRMESRWQEASWHRADSLSFSATRTMDTLLLREEGDPLGGADCQCMTGGYDQE